MINKKLREGFAGRSPMIDNNKNLMSAKEIAKKFGMSYPTLNHYTNLGFFHVVAKQGNQRFYHLGEVKKNFEIITKLKNEGYPLMLIKKNLRGES